MLRRRWWLGAIAAAVGAALFGFWLKPMLENAVRARIESSALRHGMVARIGAVHLGVWPLLRLEGLELDLGHGLSLQADTITASWPASLRLTVKTVRLAGPTGLSAHSTSTTWKISGLFGEEVDLMLRDPLSKLSLRRRSAPPGSVWTVEARDLELGRVFALRRDNQPLLDGSFADGRVVLQSASESLQFGVDLGIRGARFGTSAGDPTDLGLRFDGVWQKDRGTLEIPGIQATVGGAALSGSLGMNELGTDPTLDLVLGVKRLDFAQLLGSSGLALPESLGVMPSANANLGVAQIDLRARGRLSDPGSLTVSQTIDFKPPRVMPAAITRLRGDFEFNPVAGTGQNHPIAVSPASPDFIALREVPPLFLRTLLLAEDSAFYGHRGIDLRELPTALLTNWSRGSAARGASTITQQLAKNLFLSRDKQLGRKLQELAITFLLESELGKARILEIYLNIIEWGPNLRGLRPASRHYFGREPAALTPAEMAFLVSIIPGPILYQRSFASGTPAPGLRVLVDNLLAKLRSVDAISEEDYLRALEDPLVVGQTERDPLSSGP